MFPTSLTNLSALAIGNTSLSMLLLKATLILVVALGITLTMQRASAGARHLVWLVTLATLLLVPALGAWAPLRLAILPAAMTPATPVVPAPTNAAAPAAGVANDVVAPSWATTPSAPPPLASETPAAASGLIARLRGRSPISLLLGAWMLVMLCIGASLAWASLAVRRIVRQAHPLDTHDWRTPLWEVSDRMRLDEPPRLLRSDEVRMPFACGVITPTIVLPADCDSWSLDRRHAVLLHELAHVRRRDLLGHTLGRLVCALYWFHPLVWTAAKRLRAESERACDDLALACGTRATDYAEHLLEIVTSVRKDATPAVALAMARRKEFEGRMLAILDPELRHAGPTGLQSAGLIGALALVAVLIGAAAPTPRVANAASLYVPQSERTWTAGEQKHGRQDTVVPKRQKAYADSGVPRVWPAQAPMRMATLQSVQVRQEPRVTVSETVSHIVNAAIATPSTATSASVSATARTPSAHDFGSVRELRDFLKQEGSGQQRDSDERPVLLAKILRSDTSASLRRVAAWGLAEYADAPVASAALANALGHDAEPSVREMAAWALAHGDERRVAATAALSNALQHDADERVRATAAWAIGSIGDHAAVESLVAALGDASPSVRYRAVWALGAVGPKQAPPALVALVRDKEPRIRQLAGWALYSIADPAAIPALDAALKTEQNKDVQLADIRALAAMGEKSVDALRGLLESPDPRVKSMAVRALAGGHATGPWPWPWPEPRPQP